MTIDPEDLRAAEKRLHQLHRQLGGIAYGGDYNPEQWPREVWLEDAKLMQQAGVNLVTLAVFSWSRTETSEGVFDFEWLDDVMDLMHQHGIGVDLATPDAVPPAWLVEQYPDIMPERPDGTTFGFGSRQHFDVSHPVYRKSPWRSPKRWGALRTASCAAHVACRKRIRAYLVWAVGREGVPPVATEKVLIAR